MSSCRATLELPNPHSGLAVWLELALSFSQPACRFRGADMSARSFGVTSLLLPERSHSMSGMLFVHVIDTRPVLTRLAGCRSVRLPALHCATRMGVFLLPQRLSNLRVAGLVE